jgi:glucose-1-phosphate cytidylyltransferase
MKVVILAGGFGTRISEESVNKPKPMIEIGGMPILWHIMKYYSSFGFNDFIICGGYKVNVLKEFFSKYFLLNSDVTFDYTKGNNIIIHKENVEKWKVTVMDTGLNTMTGGRIKRIRHLIDDDDFMLTYGDGVSNVDLNALYKFHKNSKKIATLTAIQIASRYGVLDINSQNLIEHFVEKSIDNGSWINGGFMILNKKIFDYIESDETVFERESLEKLATEKGLTAYKHYGFWQCMDTLRDKIYLEDLIATKKAPWILW